MQKDLRWRFCVVGIADDVRLIEFHHHFAFSVRRSCRQVHASSRCLTSFEQRMLLGRFRECESCRALRLWR